MMKQDGMPVLPTVTVCIPLYNGAAHLAECLESVRSQTYDNIEVLVIDDYSRDCSFDVARRYEQRDSRFRVLQNPRNLGLVRNWEQCIRLARGEYIKFAF